MSGFNRLFVPDLGDKANLMLLHQSGQADVSARHDVYHCLLQSWREGWRERGKESRRDVGGRYVEQT